MLAVNFWRAVGSIVPVNIPYKSVGTVCGAELAITARIIRRYADKKAGPETHEENKTGPASPSKLTAHYNPLFPNKCAILNSHAMVCGLTL